MLHARLFAEGEKYRQQSFQSTKEAANQEGKLVPWLDGNPSIDRPLFVQFCANDPDTLLEAARRVAPYCDAVDLNLGCPQGIARKGHYGAFLQEDQDLIYRLINKLHLSLPIPVTAKIRILDTPEATLAYARNVLAAGASILTVHGRRREQKGHLTGVADWSVIRYLRENLPPDTVLFANGNVLQHRDLKACLEATGADGVMSAEGNLSDPAIFSVAPEPGQEGREYWRGVDGKGGWRVDAVMRRYMDILYRYPTDSSPPSRRPLFMPGDDESWMAELNDTEGDEPPRKRVKKDKSENGKNPNYSAMQPHMFHLLRHFVSKHTGVRDMLAKAWAGDLERYEKILALVEKKVAEGLIEYEKTGGKSWEEPQLKDTSTTTQPNAENEHKKGSDMTTTIDGDNYVAADAVKICKRPWWVAQPIVRPLPNEAYAKGAISLSKKEKKKLAQHSAIAELETAAAAAPEAVTQINGAMPKNDELVAG
jgi:tRNA-dihydrouridine synthase 1